MSDGHLFVVHGRIESLIHDAAIIPVARDLDYAEYWRSLVGERPVKPDDWESRQWGRIWNAPARVWAVSIGADRADEYEAILDRIESALRRVDERRTAKKPVRRGTDRPLVAIPVVGIGRGGFSGDRGRILRMLIERLDRLARELNLDVALVTPDPAVHAAAQYARRAAPSPLDDELEAVAKDLGQRARRGGLAVLLGAGVSAAAGLPGWGELIERLADQYAVSDLRTPEAELDLIDQAELIEAVAGHEFKKSVAAISSEPVRPSLPHGLLAGLDAREVVTTNYDLLYEQAVGATGREITSVMPWASAQGAERWVLKLHGDVNNVESIVLTRRHMVLFDAANRPSSALLQSLLLTKRLLVVGASMTDDNVIRLAHEVQAYRDHYQRGGNGTFGTVLDGRGDAVRAKLWGGQLDWVDLTMNGRASGFRVLELFLDRVGFHASRNWSWLLDERFEGLLDHDHDRHLAGEMRSVYQQILMSSERIRQTGRGADLEGTKWWPLIQRLRELGVESGD